MLLKLQNGGSPTELQSGEDAWKLPPAPRFQAISRHLGDGDRAPKLQRDRLLALVHILFIWKNGRLNCTDWTRARSCKALFGSLYSRGYILEYLDMWITEAGEDRLKG